MVNEMGRGKLSMVLENEMVRGDGHEPDPTQSFIGLGLGPRSRPDQ